MISANLIPVRDLVVDVMHSLVLNLIWSEMEEFGKFAVVATYILREIVPEESFWCFRLLRQIYRLVFSKELRMQGWDQQHQEMLKSLLWKHHIEYEHLYGLSACTEKLSIPSYPRRY